MRKSLRLKKILAIALLGFTITAQFHLATVTAEAATTKKADYKQGDNIAFGKIDNKVLNWTILSYDSKTKLALVVCREPLSTYSVKTYKAQIQKATSPSAGYVPWAYSLWRTWLNGSFYQNVFNDAERAMIAPTELTKESHQQNILNFYHDTKLDEYYLNNNKTKNSLNMNIYDNQYTTTDYIYFLSSDEYSSYKKYIDTSIKGVWPLRTSAYDDPVKSLFVRDDKQLITRMYTYSSDSDSIRPAMTVKMGEVATTTTDTTSTTSSTSTTSTASTTSDTSSTTSDTSSSTSSDSTSSTSSTSTTKTTTKKSYANNANDSASSTGKKISLPDTSQYSMSKNGTATVTLDLDYLNSTGKDYTVTYKSSNADVFTVSSTGKVTAGSQSGSATLTVRMKKSNGKSYSMTCRIDVA